MTRAGLGRFGVITVANGKAERGDRLPWQTLR